MHGHSHGAAPSAGLRRAPTAASLLRRRRLRRAHRPRGGLAVHPAGAPPRAARRLAVPGGKVIVDRRRPTARSASRPSARDDPRLGRGRRARPTGSPRSPGEPSEAATVVTVAQPRPRWTVPTVVTLRGAGTDDVVVRPPRRRRRSRSRRRRSCSTTAARRRYADNVEVVVGDGAQRHARQRCRTGTPTRSTSPSTTPSSAATPASRRSWSPSAATSSASAQRPVSTRPRRRRRAVRPLLRRRGPAPGAPALRRPRRRRTAAAT